MNPAQRYSGYILKEVTNLTDETLKLTASLTSFNRGSLSGTIDQAKKITGRVTPSKRKLLGRISNNKSLTGLITTSDEDRNVIRGSVDISNNIVGSVVPSQSILVGTILIGTDREKYEGPYEVIPSTCDQTLDTSNKAMREDVIVREIPFAEVSNPSGGTTIIIG